MKTANIIKKIYPIIKKYSYVRKMKELLGEYIKDIVLLLLI